MAKQCLKSLFFKICSLAEAFIQFIPIADYSAATPEKMAEESSPENRLDIFVWPIKIY